MRGGDAFGWSWKMGNIAISTSKQRTERLASMIFVLNL